MTFVNHGCPDGECTMVIALFAIRNVFQRCEHRENPRVVFGRDAGIVFGGDACWYFLVLVARTSDT